jgi:hypothetical protein
LYIQAIVFREVEMQAFVHGYTWKTAEDLQGLRISSAYEHYTLSPKNSRNYNLPTWTLLSVYQGNASIPHHRREKHTPRLPYKSYCTPRILTVMNID